MTTIRTTRALRWFPALLLMLSTSLGASAVDNPGALLDRIMQAQRDVRAVSGEFSQRTKRGDAPDDEAKLFYAEFHVQAPNKVDLVYRNPKDPDWRLRIGTDGQRRWQAEQLLAGVKPEVQVKPADQEGGAQAIFERIADFFNLGDGRLLKDFRLTAEARGAGYHVVVVPTAEAIARDVREIHADLDAAFKTNRVTILDTQGNRIEIEITKAVYNKPELFPAGTFTPPGDR